VIVGSLILKEAFSRSDDELLESVDIDPRFQCALHTASCGLQPLSGRIRAASAKCSAAASWRQAPISPGRDAVPFRSHRRAHGPEARVQRMDSLMIASACKRMARL
jgi:hypothetical protein